MTDNTCGHPTQAGGECSTPTTDDSEGDPHAPYNVEPDMTRPRC